MQPGVFNFVVVNGDTWKKVFTFIKNGVPMDLSAATVLFDVAPKGTRDIVFTFGNGNGCTIIGADNNKLSIQKDFILPSRGQYVFRVKITIGSVGQTFIVGNIKIM